MGIDLTQKSLLFEKKKNENKMAFISYIWSIEDHKNELIVLWYCLFNGVDMQ